MGMRKVWWTFQVWLARRFMRNLTVEKVAVIAHVTGVSEESVFATCCGHGATEQRDRVFA